MGLLDSIATYFRPAETPDVNYAESRLSHGPVLIANNPSQFQETVGNVMGLSVRGPQDINPRGPLAGRITDLTKNGQQVVVLPKWTKDPTETPGEPPGRPDMAGTGHHEMIHQFIGNDVVDPMGSVNPAIRAKIRAALPEQSYSDAALLNEIPARLGSGQSATLGLNQAEAAQLWKAYMTAYGAQNAQKAARLASYSRSMAPQRVQ
jgi:hypothetical protein